MKKEGKKENEKTEKKKKAQRSSYQIWNMGF